MAIDVTTEAGKAKSHSLEGEELTRRSISELIAAEKFRQQTAAQADTTTNFGPLFQGTKPAGTV